MVKATEEQLHWNQLRKQSLLDEKPSDFYQVAKDQLGLHSTDYWTPYLSVWARIGDYDAESMFDSIDNGRRLARTHAFRTTLHVMHIDNLSMILSATGPSLFRAYRADKYRKMDQLSDREIEDMLDRVRAALEDGPLLTTELKKLLPEVGENVRSALLMLMARGEVIRAKASHARSSFTSYALLNKWVKGFKLKLIDEQEAITLLIKSHIERFGPASVDDIAWWLRETKTTVKNVLEVLGDTIVKIEVGGSEKFILMEDLEFAASLEPPSEDLVWFLPYEDHFLKAFINRANFIVEDVQPKLFPADKKHFWPSKPDGPRKMPSKGIRATGEVRPSIWLNGQVVGRWELDDDKENMKRVVFSLYSRVTNSQNDRIEHIRSQLEHFINSSMIPISTGK
ncbi:MAG: winged helix DNA-binding domain-containing protein [Candidatus Thorarchaeota archaeon SMTZ1-45]